MAFLFITAVAMVLSFPDTGMKPDWNDLDVHSGLVVHQPNEAYQLFIQGRESHVFSPAHQYGDF